MSRLIGAVVLAFVMALGWRVSRWVAHEKALEAVGLANRARERAELFAVPSAEAFERADDRILSQSLNEPWDGAISDDIEAALAMLHPDFAFFLRRHRVIRLAKDDLEIGVECLRHRRGDSWVLTVGRHPDDPDWALCTKPGDPVVFEVNEHKILDAFPTIAHFLLLLTRD